MGDRERELIDGYVQLAQALEALLYRHDPVGIAFGDNRDEYSPEAGTILPKLPTAQSVDDVRRILHAEFVRWFDEETAGPVSRYQGIAEEVWALLGREPEVSAGR